MFNSSSWKLQEICDDIFLQLMSQGVSGTKEDLIGLDVHALNDLKSRDIPPTDDSPKYSYQADENGNYSMYIFYIDYWCAV